MILCIFVQLCWSVAGDELGKGIRITAGIAQLLNLVSGFSGKLPSFDKLGPRWPQSCFLINNRSALLT